MQHKFLLSLIAGLSMSLLAGCAELVVGGAATGVSLAHDRRSAGTVIDDQTIELKAADLLYQDQELSGQSHISVTCYNYVVLMTGETPTPELRARAEQALRGLDKVRRIHNELEIAAPSSMSARGSDALLTTRVKATLLNIKSIKGFDPTRVKVVSERGIVYLMGLVTRLEADAATEVTRGIKGVQRVIRIFEYIDEAGPH